MTLLGIQLVGIGFGLLMLYLAYVSKKKGELSYTGFAFWGYVWTQFLIIVIFPSLVSGVIGTLHIIRLMDLLMIAAFMLLFGMGFFVHKELEKQGRMIREIAVDVAVKMARKRK